MPAAAVIPAPIAYIKVVAVKKLVVGFRATAPHCNKKVFLVRGLCVCLCVCVLASLLFFLKAGLSRGHAAPPPVALPSWGADMANIYTHP